MIAVDRLRALLRYDPDTGNFIWLVKTTRRAAGEVAGKTCHGYVQIQLDGRQYLAHRLAWLFVHGEWPRGEIDHVNGCKADNRLANLRLATRSQNQANNGLSSRNRTGRKGVGWNKNAGKWQVQIGVKGKIIYLGLFDDIDAASRAYGDAASVYFGEFARPV